MAAVRRVGWIAHEKYYWHDSGLESYTPWVQPHGSNESADSKRRFANLVDVTPLADELVRIKPRLATDEEILRFHSPAYLAEVKRVSSLTEGGLIGHEMHLGPRGFDIASLSLGGVLVAVEEVMAGRVQSAYALVRPPGHHAERETGMGTFTNN
jgi:acetoin utilization deacetylase AcuC-like enzyme